MAEKKGMWGVEMKVVSELVGRVLLQTDAHFAHNKTIQIPNKDLVAKRGMCNVKVIQIYWRSLKR